MNFRLPWVAGNFLIITDMKQSLTHQESLQLITEMIQKTKISLVNNGFLYLLWGWSVFILSLAHFALQYVFHSPYIVWMACIPLLVYTIVYLGRKKQQSFAKTHYDDIISGIWMVSGILFILLYLILVYTQNFSLIITGILLLYGMPVMLMGILFKFTPLKVGAFFCWLLALGSIITDVFFHPLFIAAAMLVAWILPGYIMRREISE